MAWRRAYSSLVHALPVDRARIRAAWQGRISGCLLGKPVEVLSATQGHAALTRYLVETDALPLRDYVPLVEDTLVALPSLRECTRGNLTASVPDDDINYSVLALMLLEQHGAALTTEDVARGWLRWLPAGMVFTAERAAYQALLEHAEIGFGFGGPAGFDLALCSDNEWNDWIGAQIRADVYGWVCPGRPELAAELARRDASLSHRGEGIHGAAFVAALGAAIPACGDLRAALDAATAEVPKDSGAAQAIALGRSAADRGDGPEEIHRRYADLSPVHTLNNLAIVAWGLLAGEHDFGRAIGDTVAAGWDTDCNGATVGGLWGLRGEVIPGVWTDPWRGRVEVMLAGVGELALDDLVDRRVAVASELATA